MIVPACDRTNIESYQKVLDLMDDNAKLRAEVKLMEDEGHKLIDSQMQRAEAAEKALHDVELQVDAIRKAWDMIDGWVGCETRGDPIADAEIQAGVEAMIRALNPVAIKRVEPSQKCSRCDTMPSRFSGLCEECYVQMVYKGKRPS